jgi:hypothetical protein
LFVIDGIRLEQLDPQSAGRSGHRRWSDATATPLRTVRPRDDQLRPVLGGSKLLEHSRRELGGPEEDGSHPAGYWTTASRGT